MRSPPRGAAAVAALPLCALLAAGGGASRSDPAALLRKQQVLWPLPADVTSGSTSLQIGELACGSPTSPTCLAHGRVTAAVARFNTMVHAGAPPIDLTLACGDTTPQGLSLNDDERYTLNVTAGPIGTPYSTAEVSIGAATWVGCVRALATLDGLVENTDPGNKGVWIVPNGPWYIKDHPAYSYRGVMLDTSRHFVSVAAVKNVIDGMEAAKLNVLHLHLTDTGGWSLGLNGMPELADAAVRPGAQYTPDEMLDLVSYAMDRGISVVPEIDSPGHAARNLEQVDPALVKCTDTAMQNGTFGVEAPIAQYDVTPGRINATTAWFEKVWNATAALIPDMPYVHMGADEVNVPCMVAGTEYAALGEAEQKSTVDGWQSAWVARMQEVARALGKSLAMWQDGFLKHESVEVGADTVLQMWDYSAGNADMDARLVSACTAGTKLIQSRYRTYYLDCGGSNWLFMGDQTWCAYVSWARILVESVDSDLPPACRGNVIGASVTLWSEAINEFNLLTRAFPRSWALGERLWSNISTPNPPPVNQFWDGPANTGWALDRATMDAWMPALDRLRVLQNNMYQRGLPSDPLQPEACVVEPELCNTYTRAAATDPDPGASPPAGPGDTASPTAQPMSTTGAAPSPESCPAVSGGATAAIVILVIVAVGALLMCGILYRRLAATETLGTSKGHEMLPSSGEEYAAAS